MIGRMLARGSFRSLIALVGAAWIVAGCKTVPTVPPVEAPPLELIEAAPLALPAGCDVTESLFVEFTVRTDGRPDNLKLPSAPACAREALTAWVGSFRYAPPPVDTPSGVEWLLVTARRGS
jgi:hypothetical protein